MLSYRPVMPANISTDMPKSPGLLRPALTSRMSNNPLSLQGIIRASYLFEDLVGPAATEMFNFEVENKGFFLLVSRSYPQLCPHLKSAPQHSIFSLFISLLYQPPPPFKPS